MKRDSEGQTASEIREVNDCISSGKNFRSCHENGYSGLISIKFCDFISGCTVNFETSKSNETISQSKRCQNSSSKLHNGNA